jgi:broad specificity phosphatase PhoE
VPQLGKERPVDIQISDAHKVIAFVRHGEGEHNARGSVGRWVRDPLLTPAGVAEAQALGPSFETPPEKIDLIICSPLRRCIQTATEIWGGLSYEPPVMLTALHTELWNGKCDEGAVIESLLQDFPHVCRWQVDSALQTKWWPSGRESANSTSNRVTLFRDFLASRPERRILVVGSCCFFSRLLCISRRRLKTGSVVRRNWEVLEGEWNRTEVAATIAASAAQTAAKAQAKSQGTISVFVDNSNICLSAQRQYSVTGALLGVDRSRTLQVASLVTLVEDGRTVTERLVSR